MSYANGTQFYNLPQTVGTDKRDWFDTNEAFRQIDAALHTAAVGQAADAEAITAINTRLATDEENIAELQSTTSTHSTQIAALNTAVNENTADIADVRQDCEDMITAYNEGSAATSTRAYVVGDYFIYNDVLYRATAAIAIGDTIVPNNNCVATNVGTEVSALNSNLATLQGNIVKIGFIRVNQQIGNILTNNIIGTYHKYTYVVDGVIKTSVYVDFAINYINQTPSANDTIKLADYGTPQTFKGYAGSVIRKEGNDVVVAASGTTFEGSSYTHHTSDELSLIGFPFANLSSGDGGMFKGVIY